MQTNPNKLYKCKVCKQPFKKSSAWQTICKTNPDCVIDLAKSIIEKRKQAADKKDRKELKERKEAIKTLGELMVEAQTAFNQWIRQRDKGLPCISCGKPDSGMPNTRDAGHFRSRGAAGHLRFNPDNCHAQCKQCNSYKSGNVSNYRIGLIEKIGLERVEILERDNVPRKYTKEGLIEIKKQYQKMTKELKSG